MSDNEIISVLSENSNIFELVSILNFVLRALGWGLIQLLSIMSDGIENVINEIYTLNGFFYSKQINNLINELLPIVWMILAISIAFLGIKIIFDREFKFSSVIKNIVLSISIIMLLPMGMTHLGKMTNIAVDSLNTEFKFASNQIIKDNLYDLYYLDSVNFKSTSKNNLSNNSIEYIDIIEEIDSGEVENKDVFESKIDTDKNGEKTVADLDSGLFEFDEVYYRYKFDFLPIFISLGCTTITLLFTSFKVARIIFELGFVKLFGIMYSFADISTGQKNKEIIRCIVSNFVVLFLISLLLKMYLLFSAWSVENSKGLTQMVLLIGGSFAVIDGPNLIERVLGIDSGVKSGWQVVSGVSSGVNAMSNMMSNIPKMAKPISSMASKMGSGAINAGSGISGMVNGFNEGLKPLEQEMGDSSPNSSNENMGLQSNSNLQNEMKSNNENSENSNYKTSQDSNLNNSSSSSSLQDNNLNNSSRINSNNSSDLSSSKNNESSNNSTVSKVNDEANQSQNSVSEPVGNNLSNSSLQNDMKQSDTGENNLNSKTNSLEGDMKNSSSEPIGNNLNNSSLQNDIKQSGTGENNLNSKPNSLESDIKNSSSEPIGNNLSNSSLQNNINSNLTPNSVEGDMKNNSFKNIPIESRTLSQHLRANVESSIGNNSTIKNAKTSYSIGNNTGASIANVVKNRKKNKK